MSPLQNFIPARKLGGGNDIRLLEPSTLQEQFFCGTKYAFSADETLLLAGDHSSHIIYRWPSKELVAQFAIKDQVFVWTQQEPPGLVCAHTSVSLYDMQKMAVVQLLDKQQLGGRKVVHLESLGDILLIFVRGSGPSGGLILYNLKNKQCHTLDSPIPANGCSGLEFATLLSAEVALSWSTTAYPAAEQSWVQMWDTISGQPLCSHTNNSHIMALHVHSSSKMLVVLLFAHPVKLQYWSLPDFSVISETFIAGLDITRQVELNRTGDCLWCVEGEQLTLCHVESPVWVWDRRRLLFYLRMKHSETIFSRLPFPLFQLIVRMI